MPTKANDAFLNLYNESKDFHEVYPQYDLMLLPRWLRENIDSAHVYGYQDQCVILPDGRKYHLKNKLNDMNGRDWTLFINSVFTTSYPTSGKESYAHNIRKIHPTPKPPQLMRDLILFFTKENEMVLDTFMGVGGTLLGAALAKRQAAGIDLNPRYIDAYKAAALSLNLPIFETLIGDSLNYTSNREIMEKLLKGKPASLLLIDPPYANMMAKPKTGPDAQIYGSRTTAFTDDNRDLGNMEYSDFLSSLKQCILNTLPFIKTEGYVVVFAKDMQPHKKDLNLIHYDIISKLNEIPDLYYKGLKIWADLTSKFYPYGYPFSFVANQVHQYILIFRKEKSSKKN